MARLDDLVNRGRKPWGCLLPRITAALTGAVAALLVVELASDPGVQLYVVALVGAVVLGAAFTATRLWRANSFEARVAAVVLAVLVFVGQVLVNTVGVPGAPTAQWEKAGIAVAVLALLIPLLITADARQPAPVEPLDHPYAL